MSHSSLLLARDDEFDPQDLSFIKKMAAVGDSYSAGIGAGNRLGSAFDFLDPASGKSANVPCGLLETILTSVARQRLCLQPI
jgi:hypothetical protein